MLKERQTLKIGDPAIAHVRIKAISLLAPSSLNGELR